MSKTHRTEFVPYDNLRIIKDLSRLGHHGLQTEQKPTVFLEKDGRNLNLKIIALIF